jgi:hypothetical protein
VVAAGSEVAVATLAEGVASPLEEDIVEGIVAAAGVMRRTEGRRDYTAGAMISEARRVFSYGVR